MTSVEQELMDLVKRQSSKILELEQRVSKCEDALRRMDAALVPLQGGFKL